MPPATEASHYFDSDPEKPSDEGSVDLLLPDLSFTLRTDRGVFSRDQVDVGTKLLLLTDPPASQQTPEPGSDLADIGAGYGPIALTLAARNPETTVWAIEINSRARDLCQLNAANANLANINVVTPDEVPEDIVFSQIWSNPPIRIGKQALHQLLLRWLPKLTDNGTANMVVQKHLGADSLQRWLNTNGFRTDRYRSQKAYRLLAINARQTKANKGSADR